jgi:hypothetical protein
MGEVHPPDLRGNGDTVAGLTDDVPDTACHTAGP